MVKTTKNNLNKAPRFQTDRTGFTLIELLVVVAILGILASVAFPMLSKWVPNYQLKAASREIYAGFQKARLHAAKSNSNVTFNFTALAGCGGPTGYTFTDADGVVVASKVMDKGVCINGFTFTNDASGFNSRGLPANGVGGTVNLKHVNSSRKYDLVQSSAGNVRID